MDLDQFVRCANENIKFIEVTRHDLKFVRGGEGDELISWVDEFQFVWIDGVE